MTSLSFPAWLAALFRQPPRIAVRQTEIDTATVTELLGVGQVYNIGVSSAGEILAGDYARDILIKLDAGARSGEYLAGPGRGWSRLLVEEGQAPPAIRRVAPQAFGRIHGAARDDRGRILICRLEKAGIHSAALSALAPDGTFAGAFALASAAGTLRGPVQAYCGSDGLIYVPDTLAGRIFRYRTDGNPAGSLGAGEDGWRLTAAAGTADDRMRPAAFTEPHGITFDSRGWLYVADYGNDRIQRFDPEGRFSGFLEWQDGGAVAQWSTERERVGDEADRPAFSGPVAVAVDGANNLYVLEHSANRIQSFDAVGRWRGWWGDNGDTRGCRWHRTPGQAVASDRPGGLKGAHDLWIVAGDAYLSDTGNRRLQIIRRFVSEA